MRIAFTKFPLDILISLVWSLILLPIALFDIDTLFRIILGLPFILFIPGYLLIFFLFPTKKTSKGIDVIERIAFSFGLSIAIVPLIGLGLNYTPWGIQLEPMLLSLFFFIIIIAILALYRWFKTTPKERYIIDITLKIPKDERPLNRALSILLIISIIIAAGSLVYTITIPRNGEQFTEFYLLGKDGKVDKYPRNLTKNENTTIILGVVNHEYQLINYTIEIWLINQTTVIDKISNDTTTRYNNIWYLDTITTQLRHVPINIEEPWHPQWETNYTISINRIGTFKLSFLLYNSEENLYNPNTDFSPDPEEKLASAYRETHLWLTVTQ
jgi:uncharacterized membrane protein